MRIVLDKFEIDKLKEDKVPYSLILKIEEEESKEVSKKKINAMAKARKIKTDEVKKKIENAINLLRLENKKITVYSVSKKARISFNTAKKYKEFIDSSS